MTEAVAARQEWTTRPERGAMPLLRLAVWLALTLGRRAARLLLYPACLYFLASSPAAVRASRGYLGRALGRRAGWRDVFRHFHTFGACVLDRVFLLAGRDEDFAIGLHGAEALPTGGALLFGAHLGSFEAARILGRQRADQKISLLMYEDNAQKIRDVLAAVDPGLGVDVIGLGRLDSLITVANRLSQGHLIGVLADRNVDGKDLVRLPFLGGEAAFPRGPFRMALLLRAPVVAMAGLYGGANRYDVTFEALAVAEPRPRDAEAWIDAAMRRYVATLERHCRAEPYNWFNFYDFWA